MCCSSAAQPQCLLNSHSCPHGGGLPTAQATRSCPEAPESRSLGPRVTEKNTDFGLRQARPLAILPLTPPHTRAQG